MHGAARLLSCRAVWRWEEKRVLGLSRCLLYVRPLCHRQHLHSHIPFHSYSPWPPFPVFPVVGSKKDGTSQKSEALVTQDSWHSPGLALWAIPMALRLSTTPSLPPPTLQLYIGIRGSLQNLNFHYYCFLKI